MIVDLNLSEEQQMIEDSVTSFLRDCLPVERLRESRNRGGAAEAGVWSDLAELGLFGLGLSEDLGGAGLGLAEECLVARGFGRNLISPAALAQVLAPHLAEDDAVRDALVTGEARAALAAAGGHALDAEGADWLVVLGDSGATLTPAGEAALGEPVELIDESLSAQRLSTSPNSGADAARISLLLSAYLTGIAQAATAMSVEYAGTREQFGQPIGAFQAIKHSCADMAVRAAAAEAQVFYAAVTFDAVDNPAGEVAAARFLAEDAARENAKANIQVHGGMGFTAECDAHLLLKRAQVIAALGADRSAWREAVLAV